MLRCGMHTSSPSFRPLFCWERLHKSASFGEGREIAVCGPGDTHDYRATVS
jgi:hypothetical protein